MKKQTKGKSAARAGTKAAVAKLGWSRRLQQRMSKSVEEDRVLLVLKAIKNKREENGRNQVWFGRQEFMEAVYGVSDGRMSASRTVFLERKAEELGLAWLYSKDDSQIGFVTFQEEFDPDLSHEVLEYFYEIAGRRDAA